MQSKEQEKGWWAWLRKHRASVVVAVCFLALLAVGLTLALVLYPEV